MIYKSGKKGYYKSYEYAKSILHEMGNITAFKVFSKEDHEYYEIIDNDKKFYNLILFDENSNEYWFDTNCGYKGMGSIYTEKILQLVGLREDYNIIEEKEIYKYNLSPNNDLNVLVIEVDFYDSIEKYFIKYLINLKFKNAYLRYKALDTLQCFGTIKSINDAMGDELYRKYFENPFLEENVFGEYTINTVLFLDSILSKDIELKLNDNIKNELSYSYLYVKEIKKTEYGIYNC